MTSRAGVASRVGRTSGLGVAIGAGLLSCACSGSGSEPAGTTGGLQGSLNGRTFVAESVEGWDIVSGTEIRIAFKTTKLSATAGCNSLSGSFSIDDTKLVMHGYGSTAMGCDAPRHAQDDWLFGFLVAGPTLQLQEPQLIMTTASAKMTLLDREVYSPDRPLVGTQWNADGFSDGQTASSWQGISKANVAFDAGGGVSVFSACQTGSGTYQVSGSTISFAGFSYDGAPCSDPFDQETTKVVLLVFDGSPVTFDIEERRLTVTNGANSLSFRSAN